MRPALLENKYGSSMNGASASPKRKTEERILVTAASLFAQFGYNGVSVREIATAANVNEITIFRHYARKRELYLAVLVAELRSIQLQRELLLQISEAKDRSVAVTCAIEVIARILQDRPQLLRLLQYSSLDLSGDLDSLLRMHLMDLVEVVARHLEPLVQRGVLRCSNARTLVLTLVAVVLSRDPLGRVFLGEVDCSTSLFAKFSEFCPR